MVERLTRLALRRAMSRVAVPVIVETHPASLLEVYEEARQYEFRLVPTLLERVRGELELPLYEARLIKAFNMFAMVLPREVVFDLAEDSRVVRIYSDEVKYAFQYPTVPLEGVYSITHPLRGKRVVFTSTYWTRRLIGADVANKKGYTGRGVKVAVLDTGVSTLHEQLRGRVYKFLTVYPGLYFDLNGHGCIRGAYVYTSYCGAQKIEDLWNLIDVEPVKTSDGGEFKPFPLLALGKSGVVRVEGIYRCRAKKVRIHTPLGVIDATPWHKFMVVKPRVSGKWGKRRWYEGYEVEWKEAEKLKAREDYLLIKPYSGESWSLGVDPGAAYVAGYLCGDGTVIYGTVNIKTGKVIKSRCCYYEVRAYDRDRAQLERVAELCRELGASSVSLEKSSREDTFELYAHGRELLEKLVPLVLNPPLNDLEAMRAWIAGFFDAEGYVDFSRKRVRIANKSRELLERLAALLVAVGVPSRVVSGGCSKGSCTHHLVVLDAKAFYKFVEPYVVKKRSELARLAESGGRVHAKIIRRAGDYIALRVERVEVTGEEDYFYDLAHSSDSTYLANGVVSHNTWCTACVGGSLERDDVLSRLSGRDVLCEGVAPGCTLYHVKVLGFVVGVGTDSAIIKGLELALGEGAKVVSMSLGGSVEVTSQEEDPFYSVAKKLVESGVIPVVAAGNEGPEPQTIGTPGWLEDVLTVGAYDPITGEVARYSSRGPTRDGRIKPDVIAPGGGYPDHGIDSAIVNLLDRAGDGVPNRYSPIQGTSMATPHVAGLVALMVQAHRELLGRDLSVEEVKKMMESLGHPKNNDAGWGAITWQLYEQWLETQYGVKA